MQTDLLIFPSNLSISISAKFHYSNPQSKEISWQALPMATFFDPASNLTGNLMVHYTVAKIC